MKIVFILGSLEPKKNGVADYCYTLSKQLSLLGHQSYLISWCDRQVPHEKWMLTESTLRIGDKVNNKKKHNLIENALDKFKPDWISIQFVPYAYHKKGLPLGLGVSLHLVKKYPVHIMFHELWMVSNHTSSIKSKLISLTQKKIVKNFISYMQPKLITTSIAVFQEMLKPEAPEILPLFGNIEIQTGKKISIEPEFTALKVIIFGNFTSDKMGFEKQINWVKQFAFQLKKRIEITLIGNNGEQKEEYIHFIKTALKNAVIRDLGELDAKIISHHILHSHIGISKANYENIGKSGSTMAMLEHGISVLIRGNKNPALVNQIPKPWYLGQVIFTSDRLIKIPEAKLTLNRQHEVAKKFIDLLKKAQ
jgi:hypothetical protein